jgi:hypothetical protein
MDGEPPMPDRVDASVDDVKLTTPDPHIDGASSDSFCEKLASRHETMLPFGQPRDHPIGSLFHPRPNPRAMRLSSHR